MILKKKRYTVYAFLPHCISLLQQKPPCILAPS